MAVSEAELRNDPLQAAARIVVAMEAAAAAGEWDDVEELAKKLQNSILDVPERERRQVLLAARQSVQNVQLRAQEARDDIAGKLTALQRGRDMAAAYSGTD